MNSVLISLRKMMDAIAKNTLLVVFSIILIAAMFIKAMYCFDDSPYFTTNTLIDYIFLVVALLGVGVLYRFREKIQGFFEKRRYCYIILFGCYFGAVCLYFNLVPLIPFSDMGAVARGAIHFSQSDWTSFFSDEYWNVFPGNMWQCAFWGTLLLPFPKTYLSLKILNGLMTYGVIFLTRKIAQAYGVRYYAIVYLLTLTFLPLFFYAGHIYMDIPVTFFLLLAVYLYKREHVIAAFVFLGIARYFRQNAQIWALALVFIFVFGLVKEEGGETRGTEESLRKKLLGRKVLIFIFALCIYLIIPKGITAVVREKLAVGGEYPRYPGWNQYYIGINEAEFGFMDNDFSYDRTAQDVIDRVVEYGPIRLGKILIKKTFWLWSQGTYQAQRYAFGNDVAVGTDKFEYDTFLTGHLLRDDQPLRVLLNSLMRAQYLVVFALMIFSFAKTKRRADFRLFYYIIMATFLALIVYELKSRYILQIMPFMMIMAGDAMEIISDKHKQ